MDRNLASREYQTHVRRFESDILQQRTQLKDLGVDGRMNLVNDGGLHIVCSDFCERDDENSCYVKYGVSLD